MACTPSTLTSRSTAASRQVCRPMRLARLQPLVRRPLAWGGNPISSFNQRNTCASTWTAELSKPERLLFIAAAASSRSAGTRRAGARSPAGRAAPCPGAPATPLPAPSPHAEPGPGSLLSPNPASAPRPAADGCRAASPAARPPSRGQPRGGVPSRAGRGCDRLRSCQIQSSDDRRADPGLGQKRPEPSLGLASLAAHLPAQDQLVLQGMLPASQLGDCDRVAGRLQCQGPNDVGQVRP